ncbi:carboxylesterase [Macrococcus sp. DPC7161]|uniref:alpha/beta hydrolase n=1 Tax=Macrococcus sp. DPC7161 TaxID=2507060 RepID=UPI00100A52A3|nr:alpha/beta fold hydrolase [Macrococcus sp. DPC7161]RXK18450.1 alpha/beta fold hydrolase [Macrococcus sp. DPC7161]
MKIKSPKPIVLEGNKHAVLLLHSFTGTVRDVKRLAEALNEVGYTAVVPSYPGHGLPIEQFIQCDIDDWWQTVESTYLKLVETYETVAVIGVSLGGLFTLKLAEKYLIKRTAVMSVPMKKDLDGLKMRLAQYASRMYQTFGMQFEMAEPNTGHIEAYTESIQKFISMIDDIMSQLDQIQGEVIVMYGDRDDITYKESAEYIHQHLKKSVLQAYENSGHLMTHGQDKQEITQEIIRFLGEGDN